ncbi:hypothetical protein [Mariniphaga sp.]|uniref:hypothetical protein n=1 Tax=Mariniphaga sp. TaxID=1954475 RepID=UPI00356A7946
MKLQKMAFTSPQKNQALQLQAIANSPTKNSVQKQRIEEENLLQGKFDGIHVADNVIQRNGKGKEVVNDLTNPGWFPPGKSETNAGKAAITGAELKILLRGAAIAAWDTYSYHATKSENTESIVTKGLDPNRGGTGAASGNTEFEKHSRGQVHYTRNRGLAEDYQRHFQGDSPFGRKDPKPGPAEVLKIAVPRDVIEHEEIDPDSRTSDRAYRTTKHIPGKYIRKTNPVPIPEPKAQKRGKRKAEPLIPGANAEAWKEHVIRSFAETDALMSNMPSSATNVLYDVMKRGLDVTTVLQLVKQALQSMPASDILEFKPEDYKANPRVMQGEHIDATGDILPLKH